MGTSQYWPRGRCRIYGNSNIKQKEKSSLNTKFVISQPTTTTSTTTTSNSSSTKKSSISSTNNYNPSSLAKHLLNEEIENKTMNDNITLDSLSRQYGEPLPK